MDVEKYAQNAKCTKLHEINQGRYDTNLQMFSIGFKSIAKFSEMQHVCICMYFWQLIMQLHEITRIVCSLNSTASRKLKILSRQCPTFNKMNEDVSRHSEYIVDGRTKKETETWKKCMCVCLCIINVRKMCALNEVKH